MFDFMVQLTPEGRLTVAALIVTVIVVAVVEFVGWVNRRLDARAEHRRYQAHPERPGETW